MTIRVPTLDIFQNKINSIATAIEKKLLINDRLQVVEKWGFKWALLCLLKPIYSLLGWDVYAPLRIDRVARQLLAFCEENQKSLIEDPNLVDFIKEKIIFQLNKKTKEKYKNAILQVEGKLEGLRTYLKWPPLDKFPSYGITVEQKDRVDRAVNELIRQTPLGITTFLSCKTKVDGKAIHFLQGLNNVGEVMARYQLPFRVIPHKVQDKLAFIFLSKKVLATGGERTVRVAFDLTNQRPYVKKRITSEVESKIYEILQRLQNPIGLPKDTIFRDQGSKLQILEPQYSGSLADCLASSSFNNPKVVISLVKDLLIGLNTLHSISFDKTALGGLGAGKVANFHGDVKPANILVRSGAEYPEAVWTDFGCSAQIFSVLGTRGFQPPEFVQLLLNVNAPNTTLPENDIEEHNIKFGQKRDMWGMGLVILFLMQNHANEWPLKCIAEALEKSKTSDPDDLYIKDLKQPRIDMELNLFGENREHYRKLIEVIKKMLRVNPSERILPQVALDLMKDR